MTGFEATQKKKDDVIYTQRVKIEQAQKEIIELKWTLKEKDQEIEGLKEQKRQEVKRIKDNDYDSRLSS
jgi:molecular chaperone GrpE (heat shock protein)